MPAHREAIKDSATILINLDNISNNNNPVDSVFVIFDRYDRSGAGIVKKVFYPVNNKIELIVPRGKYYVDLYCLGIYKRRHFDRIIIARPKKRNRLFFKIGAQPLYTPGLVSMPKEKIDPGNLLITKYSSYNFRR